MKKETAKVTITFCSLVLAGMAFAADASAAAAKEKCSRKTLTKLADTYVKAQTAGKATMLPLAKGAYYGENDKPMDAAKGVLAGPLKVDFTRSFFDTTQCAAFTELVAATDPHPYVILTRMEANKKGKVSKMESVVTDQGDWVFGADKYLGFTKDEKWDEIPKDKRDTRETIQAGADLYLQGWGDNNVVVPHGTPCVRLEGSFYSGRDLAANSCNLRFNRPMKVTNQRYVIDENFGVVVVFHNFPFLDRSLPSPDPGTPAGQMFRVEGGKNRYIHELTTCAAPGCVAPGTPARGAGGPARQGGPGAGPGGPGAGPGGPGAGPGGPGGPARQGGPGAPQGAPPVAPQGAPQGAPGGA